MDTKATGPAGGEPIHLMCPTCGAKYALPKYVEGHRYGCKRCSASLMFGKFALLQELGRGGFGVVYKAWQADLHREVALKFLQSDSEESSERFTREARIAANLAHPNITPIYEVGQHDGKLYITMLFVDGTTTNKSKFSIREAVQVVRDAALAVDFAHARNIIHRDIKPHNIMVTREEASGTNPGEMSRRVYVMDFGLARSVGKGGTLTTEGQILGTPAFMSPEQAEGRTLDARSDIYSLGATLYSLVTQRAPFEANTPVQVLMLVATGSPTPPSQHNPEIDPVLEGIILKAMSRKIEDRYPTAARLAQDLGRFLQGAVTDAGPTVHISSKSLPSASTARKRRALPIAVGILLILVGAAGLLRMFVFNRKPDKDPKPPVVVLPDPGPKPPNGSPPPPVVEAKTVLDVRTEPDKAMVKAWNLQPRLSPCRFDERELPPGEYDVEISKNGWVTMLEKVTIKAGGGAVKVEKKLARPARRVAFTLDSVPTGAKVLIDGADFGKAPVTIYRDQIPEEKDRVNVTLELRGFDRKPVSVLIQGSEHDEKIALDPQTGTIVVREAMPRAKLHFFGIPEGLQVRNPRALCSLWSENADSLDKALETMDPQDAPLVAERLRALAGHGEPRIRDHASKLVVASAAATPFKPEQMLPADGAGNAVFDKAWVANLYRVLATAGSSSDFVSEEIQPLRGEETRVRVVMTAIASVGARVRPPAGHFVVTWGDGKQPLQLVPGQPAVRVPAGPVSLRFVAPPKDPLLRDFALSETVTDRYEVAGNLYLLCARAVEKADPAHAVRIYTKVLEETSWPASEDEERKRLPVLVTGMVRTLIQAAEAKAEEVPDPAQALEVAAKKPASESLGPLLEVWAAKNAPPAVKAGAAASLALASAQARRPYEAMEWLERAVAAGMDPGPAVEGAVAAAVKGFATLPERFETAGKAIAAMRQAALRKPGYLGVRLVEVVGRGVKVDGLSKGGPAEAAGLQFGDFLLELGGAGLKVTADFDQAMKGRAEGEEVEVKFERAGEKKSAMVKLAAVPAVAPEFTAPPLPPPAPSRLGVLTVLSAQFGHIVKLDAPADVKIGDALEVVRKGEVVAELLVTRTTRPDSSYPHGSAVCKPTKGAPLKGDEVRRKP